MSATRQENNQSLTLVAALEGYSDVYLDCRGIQHRWDITADLHISEKLEGEGELVERHLTCEKCETVRKDRFLLRSDRWSVRRLEVIGAVYKYPDGYLMKEMGLADHPREILRNEQLRRVLNKPKAARKAAKQAAAQAS